MGRWKHTLLPIVVALPVLIQCKSGPQTHIAKGASEAAFAYIADAFDDSSYNETGEEGKGVVGGTPFEIYGMAYKELDGYLYIAINSNLGPEGIILDKNDKIQPNSSGKYSGQRHIGFGDMIFNFAADQTVFPMDDAPQTKLYAVHFADGNDTQLTELGLFQDVKATSLASLNGGFPTLKMYNDRVLGFGKTPTTGELAYTDPYFDVAKPAVTSIATGTRVVDDGFVMLSATELDVLGVDFSVGLNTASNLLGTKTFGFKIKRPAGMTGAFTASLTPDCGNDLMAFRGTFNDVPPTTSKLLVIKKLWVHENNTLVTAPPASIDAGSFAITAVTSTQSIRCAYAVDDLILTCTETNAAGQQVPVEGLDITDAVQYTIAEEGLPAGYHATAGIGTFVVGTHNNCVFDEAKNITVCEHKVTNAAENNDCPEGVDCGCGQTNQNCSPTPCTGKDCVIVPPTPCAGKECVIVPPAPCHDKDCVVPVRPIPPCGFLATIVNKIFDKIKGGCSGFTPPKPGCGGQLPPAGDKGNDNPYDNSQNGQSQSGHF